METMTEAECCGAACCVPAEFVRVRYYFAQRLGVIEFADEQAYHSGKQRFHNARAHGAGVLCGLAPGRFVFPQGAPPQTPTTVLRVTRGAALDACGHELVVGGDQCIDVAAWFAKHRTRKDLAQWAAGAHPLWVGLRYRECPSDPSPAPRDPCGCDAGGCEYGRVREGFELALLTDEDLDGAPATSFPTRDAVRAALGEDALAPALARLVAGACPDGPTGAWLVLGRLTVQVDVPQGQPARVIDITAVDVDVPARVSLLSTAALQALVEELAEAGGAAGAVGPGPRLGAMTFDGKNSTSGTLQLDVVLLQDPGAQAPTALAKDTFDPAFVKVMSFNGTKWTDVTPPAAKIDYDDQTHLITLEWATGKLAAGRRYRMSLAPPVDQPIVDELMRPLRPAPFTRQYQLVDDGSGKLTLAATLF